MLTFSDGRRCAGGLVCADMGDAEELSDFFGATCPCWRARDEKNNDVIRVCSWSDLLRTYMFFTGSEYGEAAESCLTPMGITSENVAAKFGMVPALARTTCSVRVTQRCSR